MEEKVSVFVFLDGDKIMDINSSVFLADTEGWTEIDSGNGDRFVHAYNHYLPGRPVPEDGIPRYKLVEGKPVERAAEEIEADRAALPKPDPAPSTAHLYAAARMIAQTASDAQALTMTTLFPMWAPNVKYGGDGEPKIVQYLGQLYRCQSPHTSQTGWEPDKTPALWVAINHTQAGTVDDPIPASRGMEYTYGLYYKDPENGITYLCRRAGEVDGGTVVLQYLPHELIGHYFEEVQ